MRQFFHIYIFLACSFLYSQSSNDFYQIINQTNASRIENDIKILANFGTRHSLSDTISNSRGIGAARRWIKSEFEKISKNCNNCLEVFYQKNYYTEDDGPRIVKPVWINNVVAIQKGRKFPNRFIIMSIFIRI